MKRRPFIAIGAMVLWAGLLVLGEIMLALRREFFVEGPERRIEGIFGEDNHPTLRFVVMGDSTSIGVGATADDSYPVALSQRLSDEMRVELEVLGRSGDRTVHMQFEQLPDALRSKPDLVLICIGANDATHLSSISAVRRSVGEVLDALIVEGIEVVVAGPPDMGAAAFFEPLRSLSRASGYRVSRAIEGEARARGVAFIPLGERTRAEFASDPNRYFSKDLFHPGPEGYRLYAEVMFPVVRNAAKSV